MRITGRINEWNLIKGTFKVYTPAGDFEIATEKLDEPMVDALIDAMKGRRDITISDGEGENAPPFDMIQDPGCGEHSEIFNKWTVVKTEYHAASRTFRVRVRDHDSPTGYYDVIVPATARSLARGYIETTLLYGDLMRRAEEIARSFDSPETHDTKKELRELVNEHIAIAERRII